MTSRPKLHIPKTKMEWLFDVVGYIALAVMIVVIVFNWSVLPDEVPAHFNAKGEVDRYGSKWELLILPAITIAMHVFLVIIERYPHVHNYPERLNEQNAEAFYTNSRQTVNYMRNLINLLFAYLTYNVLAIALEEATGLRWPFFAILAALFIVLIYKMYKITKIH